MRRIAIAAAVAVALAVLAVGVLLALPPTGLVKNWLVQQAKDATGREVAVNGRAYLKLLPRPVLRLEDVVLSNPPGRTGDPLLAARAIQAETGLWRLIVGQSTVEHVRIEEPRVALAIDEQGQSNWVLARGAGERPPVKVDALTIAGGSLAYQDARSGAVLRLTAIDADAQALAPDRIGEIILNAGALHYRAADGASPVLLEKPRVSAKSASLGDPLDAAIAFDWNKERVTGNIKIKSPAALTSDGATPASVRLSAPKGTFDVDGSLAVAATVAKIEGKARAEAPSLRVLAAWLGAEPPKYGALGAVRIEGNVTAQGRRITLDAASITLDATKATGSLAVDLGGARPRLSGTLAADQVDADSYLGAPARTRAGSQTRSGAPAGGPAVTSPVPVKEALKAYMRAELASFAARSGAEPVVTLEDLTGRAPTTRSRSATSEWSDDPIDLSALRSVDLDLSLSIAKLTVAGFDMGVSDAKAALADGTLSIDAKDLAVEGGKVTGKMSLDARGAQPKLATAFKAEGVDTLAIFDAVGLTGLIAGKSSLAADLSGDVGSQRRLVETLTGRVKAEMSQGEIVGYDFSSIWSWIFGPRQYDASKRSPFDRLEADVALSGGVTRDSRLQIVGPVLGVAADGTTRLPSREIDYRARLKLAAWFRPIALRIFGEWPNPSYVPDWSGSVRSPEALENPLEALKDADLKDAELARLVGEVLEKASGTNALTPQATPALEALKARAEGRE